MLNLEQLFAYSDRNPLLFNQYGFLFLFSLMFAGYSVIYKKISWRNLYLLAFSLFFYYKCSGLYFLLLIFSTLVDYGCGYGIYIAKEKWEKQIYLVLSLVANLGLLAFFKYSYFLVDSINTLFGSDFQAINFLAAFANGTFGSHFDITDIILPVGISFYTFQTMSYTIDIYRNQLKPCNSITDFAFFVSFFPQLVAGPIVRAADFIPQINKPYYLSHTTIGTGIFLIMNGLIKKVVISDYISINFVDRVFEAPEMYSGFMNLMAVYGYSIQIYCDFSGYSDMAIGLAALLGFTLPINFNSPYKATNITDFWRRWHISLSTWLRDYLYISLGGNRKGKIRTYINLAITMLLGGLWHGAALKFIIWGGLHGLALVLHKIWVKNRILFSRYLSLVLLLIGLVLVMANRSNITNFSSIFYVVGNQILPYSSILFILSIIVLVSGVAFSKLNLNLNLSNRLKGIIAGLITFHFVAFCWMYFRAPDMITVGQMLENIFTNFNFSGIDERLAAYWRVFGILLLGFIIHLLPNTIKDKARIWFTNTPIYLKVIIFALVVFLTFQATSADVQPFIYFQF